MTRELYQKSEFVRANGNVYEVCNGIDLCEICLYVCIYIYHAYVIYIYVYAIKKSMKVVLRKNIFLEGIELGLYFCVIL